MSSIRELYWRFRHLIHEGAKFLVIGGIGSLVTIGGAGALHDIGKYKAVTIATIVATIVTFLGNRYWTFRHREGHGTARESMMFFLLNGVGLIIYYACIGFVDVVLGLKTVFWYYVALVLGTGFGTLFRFWSYRKWVWPKTGGGPVQVPLAKPARTAAAFARRPQGRHAMNGHGLNGHRTVGPVQQERLPDPEVSETSGWPR